MSFVEWLSGTRTYFDTIAYMTIKPNIDVTHFQHNLDKLCNMVMEIENGFSSRQM